MTRLALLACLLALASPAWAQNYSGPPAAHRDRPTCVEIRDPGVGAYRI